MIAIISNQISDEEKLSHLINIPNIKVSKKLNVIDGIRYRSGKRNCFEAYVIIDGKQKTKHFSINKYGYEEAKRLAEEAKIVLQTLIN